MHFSFLSILCVIAITVQANAVATDPSEEVDVLLVTAQRALGVADYTLASELLLGLLELSPEHENANSLLGSSYLALERADLAEGFLFTALKVSNFSNVGAANNLAEALRLNGDKELAVKLLELTMQRTSKSDLSGLLEHTLGGIYEESLDFQQAGKWYLTAALLQPKNALYWQSASTLSFTVSGEEGGAAGATGVDLQAAERVLAQGLSELPLHPDLLFQLGLVMQQSNRLSEACTLFEETLRQHPPHPSAPLHLATALHSLGRHEEALPFYQSAVQQTPSNVILLQNYATLLNALSLHQQAYGVISEVAVLLPEDEGVRGVQSDYKKQAQGATSRKLQTQANLIEAALQSSSSPPSAHWDGVVTLLQQAGTPAEDAAWWFFAAGMAQFFRGNYPDSIACCKKAQSLLASPSHLTHGCQGLAHQYNSDHDAAIEHFSAAHELLADALYEDPLPFLGFSMDQADIEVNLISALNVRGDYDQCLSLSLRLLGLPSPSQGGVTTLLFSFIDWTPSMRKHVNTFGSQLVQAHQLTLPRKKTLFDEALRVQNSKKKFLNAAYECVTSSEDPAVMKAHREAAAAISHGILHTSPPPLPPRAAAVTGSDETDEVEREKSAGFVLITQFYFPDDLTLRQNIQDVLIRNLENDAIDEIYLIAEEEYNFDQLPNYHKITKFILKGRLKFADALRVANDRLAGRSVILCNSDIYFDQSLSEFISRVSLPLHPSLLLALSTWAPSSSSSSTAATPSSSLALNLRSDSQDAWLLTAPVSEEILSQTDFYFGVPRCDNRLAKVFMNSGYRVKNPAFLVHAVEVDSQQRASHIYSKLGEVHGEVANVPISDSSWL